MADSRLPASTATSRFIELPSSPTEYELCTKPIVTAAINETDDKHQGTKSAKILIFPIPFTCNPKPAIQQLTIIVYDVDDCHIWSDNHILGSTSCLQSQCQAE